MTATHAYPNRLARPPASAPALPASRPMYDRPNSALTFDLPLPPSTNRLWRNGKGRTFKSPEYASWLRQADYMAVAKGYSRLKPINGKFTAHITIDKAAGGRRDLDNSGAKASLDWLQSRGFIVNDKHAEKVSLVWGDAPEGIRIVLEPSP